MTNITIREFESEDLGPVLELWERESADRGIGDGMTIDQAVDLLRDESTVTLLAEIDSELAGMGVASARSTHSAASTGSPSPTPGPAPTS